MKGHCECLKCGHTGKDAKWIGKLVTEYNKEIDAEGIVELDSDDEFNLNKLISDNGQDTEDIAFVAGETYCPKCGCIDYY